MAALGTGKTIQKWWPGENPPLPLDICGRGMSRRRDRSWRRDQRMCPVPVVRSAVRGPEAGVPEHRAPPRVRPQSALRATRWDPLFWARLPKEPSDKGTIGAVRRTPMHARWPCETEARPHPASAWRLVAMSKTRQNLTRVDTAWLRMEDPTNLMMSSGLLLLDELLALEDLTAVLEQRLDGFPRFRRRVVEPALRMGSPVWELDEHFDLRSHIHRVAVPAPGGPDQLQALISDLVSTPLDFTKPPWQLHLIDGVGTGSAVLARIHHCMADGIALMHVLWSLTDEHPGSARSGSDATGKSNGRHAGVGRQLLGGVGTAVRHPDIAVRLAETTLAASAATAQLTVASPDSHTVLKGRLGVSKRAAWSERLSLRELKHVATAFDATFNDVMMAAVAGGMSAYLAGRDVDVDQALVRAAVPVNLRPLDLAGDLGNVFGLLYVQLPLQPERVEDRVRHVKRLMKEA